MTPKGHSAVLALSALAGQPFAPWPADGASASAPAMSIAMNIERIRPSPVGLECEIIGLSGRPRLDVRCAIRSFCPARGPRLVPGPWSPYDASNALTPICSDRSNDLANALTSARLGTRRSGFNDETMRFPGPRQGRPADRRPAGQCAIRNWIEERAPGSTFARNTLARRSTAGSRGTIARSARTTRPCPAPSFDYDDIADGSSVGGVRRHLRHGTAPTDALTT